MKYLILSFLGLFLISCVNQNQTKSESILFDNFFSKNGSKSKKNMLEGISVQQVKNARLWKQKGEKYLKKGEYSLGMSCINKAVKLNEQSWKPYEAFAKCIYLKNYTEAIKDFKEYKNNWGNNEVEGHDCNFYLGICYLQNNELESAKRYFYEDKSSNSSKLFYLGIVEFKRKKYKQAISYFDRAIKIYLNFLMQNIINQFVCRNTTNSMKL